MPSSSLLEGVCATADQSVALSWRDGQVSYGELRGPAIATAARLAALGPATGTVGVAADSTPDALALVLGCLLVGRPFLLPPRTLAPAVRDELFAAAMVDTVLTTPAPTGPATAPAWKARSDRTTFCLTTSGSTGLPKIVPLTEGAVDRFTDWAGAQFDLGPGSRVLSFSPLHFDLSLLEVWATLKHGGRVVRVDSHRATDSRYLHTLLTQHRVTFVQAVPLLFQLLVTSRHARYPSVRDVVITGETIRPECLSQLPRLFPNARLHNIYGCTETNDSLRHVINAANLAGAAHGTPIPLGTALPGVATVLVGSDGRLVRGAGVGELYVHTPFQSRGYLGTPALADRFTSHPTGADNRRYFRSGDLVRRDRSGVLTLIGRTDHQVKIRGVRTNLAEVEQVLHQHPGVAEAVALAVPDELAGQLLHVVIHRRAGSGLDSLALRQFCVERLPRSSLPTTTDITDQPLPRTSTGKPDRRALRSTLVRPEKGHRT